MQGLQNAGTPKRRIMLVEKPFQLRFVLKMTGLAVLGTGLTAGLLFLLADREFGRVFFSAHYQARSAWEVLLPAVLTSAFAGMLLVAALAAVLTLYDSHRIGGPLYRFRANLLAVGRGDLTLVTRLREGDELQSLTGAMNDMTQSLRAKVEAIRDAASELESLAHQSPPGLSAEDGQPGAGAGWERLRRAIGEFRIDG